MLDIVNYEEKYSLDLNKLDENYWGKCESERVSDDIKGNDIVKVALKDSQVVGFLHFKIIGDLIDAYHILVLDEFQRNGIGSKLMQSALDDIKKLDVKTIIAHAVEFNGHINSQNLLEKFGFQEMYRVKNYWDSLYPGVYCKQCNSNKCSCGAVIYMLKL